MFLNVLGSFYMFLHVLAKKVVARFGVFFKHVVELYSLVKTEHVINRKGPAKVRSEKECRNC